MRKYYRVITWLQVILQFSFPLLTAVTPAANASLRLQEELLMRKKIYTLAKGESVASIARRESLTPDQLWMLNRYLFPSREVFEQASEGDVLYLPYSADDAQRARGDEKRRDENETRYAGSVSKAGSLISAEHPTDSFISYVSNSAVSQVEQWLNKFGTAKVSVQPGQNSQFSGSAVDMLYPLYDDGNRLTFTQFGLRRQDDRSIANIGVGQRVSFDRWMLGYNAFYDAQISGNQHKRLGIGGELWADNLKLAANGYYRLSGWKASHELEDYDERLANGFDIRAESWLPAWPQLGGKLTYEQYFGREVALFSRDQRQSNPAAVTAGINYTPFPLMTVGLEHSQGSQDANETRLKLDFNYQFTTPFRQQLDTEAVRQQRTLTGSRLDLVDRNNNLVFEYRRQELIALHLPAEIKGTEGEKQPINFTLKSKYGLDHIVWDDSTLVAQGGKVIALAGDRYQLQLPAFHPGSSNEFNVSAVAWDKRGNISRRSEMKVRVNGYDYQQLKAELTMTPEKLPADGKSEALFQWRINSLYDQPVRDIAQRLKMTLNAASRTRQLPGTLSEVKESQPGVYEAIFTSLTRPGKLTLSTRLEGSDYKFPAATLELIAAAESAVIQDVQPDKNTAVANDNDEVTFTAVVKDAENNAVPDLPISWEADSKNVTLTAEHPTTDKQGKAIVHMRSRIAQRVIVSARLNDQKKAAEAVSFTADSSSAQIVSLTLDKTSVIADGIDQARVEATVHDAQNNPFTGKVRWSTDKTDILNMPQETTTDSEGKTHIDIRSTTVGKGKVTARIGQSSLTSGEIDFRADASRIKIVAISSDKNLVKADGQDKVVYTATVKDANNNLLPDQPVRFIADSRSPLLMFSPRMGFTKTNPQGEATISLSSIRAQPVIVTAYAGDTQMAAQKVNFSADGNLAQVTSADISKRLLAADGKDSATYTVLVEDAFHNKLKDVPVSWRVTDNNGATLIPAAEKTDKNGRISALLSGTQVGGATVEVTPDGGEPFTAPQVTFFADGVSGKIDALQQSATSFVAGTAGVTYTVKVSDKHGNALPSGTAVAWTLIKGDSTQVTFKDTSVTNDKGEAQTTLQGTRAGNYTLRAILNGQNMRDAQPVTILPAIVNATHSSFSADKTLIASDGIEKALLSIALRDQYDNAVEGQSVNLEQQTPLTGFTTTPVQESANGIYTATASAQNQGETILHAKASGVTVGKPVTIKVGAITPPLTFDNATQTTPWTKTFKGSQQLKNLPAGLTATWSSSDPKVATVDDTGTVTLLSAGTTKITASTSATGQYDPAWAYYTLIVERADPQLQQPAQVVRTWNDDVSQPLTVTFANPDAADLTPKWSSNNPQVTGITPDGQLTLVKPGTATLTVETEETPQFNASKQDVGFTLNKARLNIQFEQSEIKQTVKDAFTLQQPTIPLPDDAEVSWHSSDSNVIDLDANGTPLSKIQSGSSELSLRVEQSAFYESVAGSYRVKIYDQPTVNLGIITRLNRDTPATSGDWTPTFTSDTLTVNWTAVTGNPYSAPQKVHIQLLDANGNMLGEQVVNDANEIINPPPVVFQAKPGYVGKTIKVKLRGESIIDTLYDEKTSGDIKVAVLPVEKVWKSAKVVTRLNLDRVDDGYNGDVRKIFNATDQQCRSSSIGQSIMNKWIFLSDMEVTFQNGKVLLQPMTIKIQAKGRAGNMPTAANGWPDAVDIYETQIIQNSKISPNMPVDGKFFEQVEGTYDGCWYDEVGYYDIIVNTVYGGVEKSFSPLTYQWSGNGDSHKHADDLTYTLPD